MRFVVFLLWLMHFLPLSIQAAIGNGLGWVLYKLARSRTRVARINLKLCFPELSDTERETLVRKHVQSFMRGALDHGLLWWAPRRRLEKLIRIEGLEHWLAVKDQPVIWLAPHFMGLDAGGTRLAMDYPAVSMYGQQKNPYVMQLLLRSRTRFGTAELYSRQDGIKPVIKAIRKGLPFYYLPDQDFGASDAVFVPFFGVSAATVTGLSRLARVGRAKIVPAISRQLPGGQGYVLTFYPAWENFPSDDVEADTRRMNEFIEQRVREMPEQYFWTHKRFKTRPPGEAKFY